MIEEMYLDRIEPAYAADDVEQIAARASGLKPSGSRTPDLQAAPEKDWSRFDVREHRD